MTVEAMVLLVKISSKALEYSNKYLKPTRRFGYFLGWCLPGLIVAIAASRGFMTNTYMDQTDPYRKMAIYKNTTIPMYHYCWISAKSRMRFPAAIFPLSCSWIFCAFVLIKVTYFVTKKRKQETCYAPQDNGQPSQLAEKEWKQILSALNALRILMPVLGTPWIFAFLAGKLIA